MNSDNPNPELPAVVERARAGEIDTPTKCPVCLDARLWVLDGDRRVPFCPYCCRYRAAAQDEPPVPGPVTPRKLHHVLTESLYTAERAAADYAEMYDVDTAHLNRAGSPEVARDMAAMAWFVSMLSMNLDQLAYSSQHAEEAPAKPRRPTNRKGRPRLRQFEGVSESVIVTSR